ncbi:uncharacterized protein [Polyergus mexicanus]|uniref:uncharacterized protein isoform X4 n=1 Tax=Polyergus mexicanus TaxID=615972 RepID=UPI0038B4DC96
MKSSLQNVPIIFDYIKDTEYSIQPIRWLLRPISIWPVSSMKEKILSMILLLVCVFLIASTLIPCALAIFLDETKDVEAKVRDLGPLSNWVLASLKYCTLLTHVGDIRRCIEHIESDWRAVTKIEEREVMLKNARIGRFIAIFAATFVHSGVFSYSIFRGMTLDESAADNVSVHSLPFAFYDKILDTTTSPTYEIVFAIQFLSTFVVNSIVAATCSITSVFVMHACGQLKILISLLDNFIDKNEKRNFSQQKFAVVVEHHLKLCILHRKNYECCLSRGNRRMHNAYVPLRLLLHIGMEPRQQRYNCVWYNIDLCYFQYFYILLHRGDPFGADI